jgi:hypothetical protein
VDRREQRGNDHAASVPPGSGPVTSLRRACGRSAASQSRPMTSAPLDSSAWIGVLRSSTEPARTC